VVEITAHRLAQAVGEYLDSERAKQAIHDCLESATTENSSATATGERSHRIRVRTTRCWLNNMGFHYGVVQKGVYIDGHEREDVVDYRVNVFIPRWKELERRMVIFNEDGTWEKPPGISFISSCNNSMLITNI